MSGKLTTHVLDTAHGVPAAGMTVVLRMLGSAEGGDTRLLKTAVTNADGRLDGPLLEGSELRIGTYELEFDVGAYFSMLGVASPSPAFLGVVPVRFGIADGSQHYHVPLLVSPFAYSTYRGS
jgi:5-hydroxyisourate hydrolase